MQGASKTVPTKFGSISRWVRSPRYRSRSGLSRSS
jgi:hypothetical protein